MVGGSGVPGILITVANVYARTQSYIYVWERNSCLGSVRVFSGGQNTWGTSTVAQRHPCFPSIATLLFVRVFLLSDVRWRCDSFSSYHMLLVPPNVSRPKGRGRNASGHRRRGRQRVPHGQLRRARQ